MSRMRSVRMAGPSTTRPPSGACGSTGCPSKATTSGRWSLNSSPKMRAGAALMRRRRIRSPDCTAKRSGTRPLIVTVLPIRPRNAHFHAVSKAASDRSVVVQTEIAEDPDDVAIDRQGLRLLDDQCAHQAAPDLLGAVRMRVVPEGAGIGRRELV